MLRPILVLGSGRDGSTALMGLLGGSPKIAFDKRYPYEAVYLSYLAQLASVICQPFRGPEEEWDRSALVTGRSSVLGPIPFDTGGYLGRDRLSRAAFPALWRVFSDEVVASARRQKVEAPTFYAEKAGFFTRDLAGDQLNALEIVLLRDPRDVMISSKQFNEKRGTIRFGWLEDDTDARFARRLIGKMKPRLEAAIAIRHDDPKRILVRYEDFVLNPEATARRLSDFLGLELRVADQLQVGDYHRTSADAASSVARWRREMDDHVKAIFDRRLGDLLEQAGYERARAPQRRRKNRLTKYGASDGT